MASLNVLDEEGAAITKVYFLDSEGDKYYIEKSTSDFVLIETEVSSIAILRKDLPKLIRLIEKAIELNM